MAFPTVLANVSGFVSSTAGLTANATITLPSTINSGDMLLAIFAANGGTGTTITWNSSAVGPWTQIASNTQTTSYKIETWQRIADGTEDGKQLRIDLDSTRPSAWIVYRINNFSTITPNVGVNSLGYSSGTSQSPPNLSPPWSPISVDTLWFAVIGHTGLSGSITGVPDNYTDNVAVNATGGATARQSLFSTQRNLNASSEDPGNYTRSSTGSSLTLTVAVRGLGIGLASANVDIYANESTVIGGSNLSGVTNVLLTSGTRNVQTTITSVDSGNVYFTVPPVSTLLSSNIRFQSVTLTANDSSSSGSIGSNLLPNTGYGVHNITDTSQVGAPTCIYYGQVPSLVVGDQILYQSSNVSIDAQGFPTFSNNVTQFDYYIFDSTDETWGTVGTYYAANTTPSTPPITYFSQKIKMYIRVV